MIFRHLGKVASVEPDNTAYLKKVSVSLNHLVFISTHLQQVKVL